MPSTSPRPDPQLRLTEAQVLRALQRASLGPGDVVIAAVSGGPDSSALLLLLCDGARGLGLACEAAYFDHQIRSGAEREAEQRSVERLALSAGVPLHFGAGPVLSLARQHGRSLEDEARVQRYRFLAQTAMRRGAQFVATGHTADDQVETVLLHMLRGSGLLGLVGMKERIPWPLGAGPVLLRPLLGLTRAQTAAYADAAGVLPHHDSENDSPHHLRNRVRRELLPLLESFNPQIRAALIRLSNAAADQCDLLQVLGDEATTLSDTGATVAIELARLRNAPAALRADLLARAFAAATGGRSGLTARHVAALTGLLEADGERGVDLPHGLRARIGSGRLLLDSYAVKDAVAAPAETSLPVPGRSRIGGWVFESRLIARGEPCRPNPSCAVLVQEDAAGLTFRRRRPGDRMRLAAGEGHKKLQDLLVDAKVPRSQRDALPVCWLDGELVWVPGVRAAACARVDDASAARVAIVATPLDADSPAAIRSEQPIE